MAEKGDCPSASMSVHAFLQNERASSRRPFHQPDYQENHLEYI
jgi:hypothetical protein